MTRRTTVGQILVSRALPEPLRDRAVNLDKKRLGDLLADLARDHPEEYREVSHKLMQVGKMFAQDSGSASFGPQHLRTPPQVAKAKTTLRRRLAALDHDSNLSDDEHDARVIAELEKFRETHADKVLAEAEAADNPLAKQVTTGARGNPAQLARVLSGDILQADHRGKTIPVPLLRSYSQGLTPAEYWATTYGSRQGIVSTKLMVQKAGYLAKQLVQAVHRLQVQGLDDDAEADENRGYPVDTADEDSEGSLLARAVGGYKRNTVLTPKILADLRRKKVKDILIRSPIVGGSANGGVYARDVGVRESGRFPDPGSTPGITAAQALAEPISQASLSSKHGATGNNMGGFGSINQVIQGSPGFVGGAVHTAIDGRVRAISDSPTGGKNVLVDGETYHIPRGLQPVVQLGDTLEAGDPVSEGVPNVAALIRHKGIGEGRRQFVNALRRQLRLSGVKHHRRNIEMVARGMADYVKLDDELGDYAPGDIVPYHMVERAYQPRKDAREVPVAGAVGQYLERPVLHYTVGDRIKPSMLTQLRKFNISRVTAHPEPPGFSPHFVRGEAILQNDPDWVTRQLGSHLQSSVLSAAHRGESSDTEGTSFVPALVRGEIPGAAAKKREGPGGGGGGDKPDLLNPLG